MAFWLKVGRICCGICFDLMRRGGAISRAQPLFSAVPVQHPVNSIACRGLAIVCYLLSGLLLIAVFTGLLLLFVDDSPGTHEATISAVQQQLNLQTDVTLHSLDFYRSIAAFAVGCITGSVVTAVTLLWLFFYK